MLRHYVADRLRYNPAEGLLTCIFQAVPNTASVTSRLHADAPPAVRSGSISAVIRTAPSLFVFCLVQIGLHLGIILGAGRLMGFSRRDVLLASNANVGGEPQWTLPKGSPFTHCQDETCTQ